MTKDINCIIIDDEPVARSIIRNYCGYLPFLKILGEFGNALEAKEFLTDNHVDLLFLDINMPVLSGMGFIQTLKNPPLVIFTTAYQEHAVNAFEMNAVDYLLKPFPPERFIVAVDKAKDKLSKSHQTQIETTQKPKDSLFIRSEGKIYQLTFNDCLFAEAQGNYTKVVTEKGIYITKNPFSTFISDLPADIFLRSHRSFIINKNRIGYIAGNRVFIGDHEIPIAANYRLAFLAAIGIH